MNLFEAVKRSVTTRQAAQQYGISVNQNGMAVCPFHKDRHPSMKVDHRFHCFGCLADGDVIDFTARLYHLPVREAAEKLAADFGVFYDTCWQRTPRPVKPLLTEEMRFKQAEHRCYDAFANYLNLLKQWQRDYAPKPTDTEWHPLFVEAMQKQCDVEALLDTLLSGTVADKAAVIIEHGKEVPLIERRLSEFAAGNPSGCHEHRRSHGAELDR